MKQFSGRALAAAATVATLALASPAAAQTSFLGVDPTQVPNFPTVAEVVALCNLDATPPFKVIVDANDDGDLGQFVETCDAGDTCEARSPVESLLIPVVADGTVFGGSFLDDIAQLSVTISAAGTAFLDETDESQQTGTPGVDAVAVGKSLGDPANVYCYIDAVADSLIEAATGNKVPTRLEFYWSRGPCLLSQPSAVDACFAYEDPNDEDRKNYLQAHLLVPVQDINICGCPLEVARFCDPLLATGVQGACPAGDFTALTTQGVVTTGATCQRVVIGGRAFFIGDTCE
jgi:hypothetical protein